MKKNRFSCYIYTKASFDIEMEAVVHLFVVCDWIPGCWAWQGHYWLLEAVLGSA